MEELVQLAVVKFGPVHQIFCRDLHQEIGSLTLTPKMVSSAVMNVGSQNASPEFCFSEIYSSQMKNDGVMVRSSLSRCSPDTGSTENDGISSSCSS